MRLLFLSMLLSSAAFAQNDALPGMQPSRLSLTGERGIELRVIDNQIQLLEFQKVSMVGPIFLTAFGGVTVLTGIGISVMAFSTSAFILIIAFPVLAIGVLLVSVGVVWLLVNLGVNRRIDHAIEALHDQRPSLAHAPGAPEMKMVTLATF